MSQFVADFEAYIPAEFNGNSYGKAGVLATADKAGIDVCVLFMGGVPADPRGATRRSTGLVQSVDANGGRSRVLTARLAPRTGSTDTSASSGIVSEPCIAKPRSGRR